MNVLTDYRFLPLMAQAATKQDPGRLLIISSTAGTNVPHVGEHGTIMYAASKAAADVSLDCVQQWPRPARRLTLI